MYNIKGKSPAEIMLDMYSKKGKSQSEIMWDKILLNSLYYPVLPYNNHVIMYDPEISKNITETGKEILAAIDKNEIKILTE